MRDSNENMIELIDVSKSDDVYSSIISHKIADKVLKLRFGINLEDYVHLKRILEFRPFDNTGVAPYRYFFALSYRRYNDNENLGHMAVRVEQLNRNKQYEFTISRMYIANILWFNSLTDTTRIEQMIEK